MDKAYKPPVNKSNIYIYILYKNTVQKKEGKDNVQRYKMNRGIQ